MAVGMDNDRPGGFLGHPVQQLGVVACQHGCPAQNGLKPGRQVPAQVRNDLVANTVPGNGQVSIGRVLPKRNAPFGNVGAHLSPRGVEERADD